MKNRRTSVAAFLLLSSLALGVGYAALSDSFTVTGDLGANVDNNNLVVVYDGETANSAQISSVDGVYCNFATASGVSAIDGRTTAELNFQGLNTSGNKAWAKLVVENRSVKAVGNELDATLSDPVVNYKSIDQTMFKITATWESDDRVLEAARTDQSTGTPIAAGYNTIYVEVELLKTPTSSVTASQFEVTFTASTN